MSEDRNSWFISAEGWGDGKSVCLWMQKGVIGTKIARFQSKEAAIVFIRDFKFPVSDRVQAILDKREEEAE
jgi:hypothetical protein